MNLKRVLEFQASRIPEGTPDYAYPLDVSAAINLKEALHLACTANFVAHKDGVMIQMIDHAHGKHRAWMFRIVEKAPTYRGKVRIKQLGHREERNWPLLEPMRLRTPPTTEEVLADPIGRDRNLIEGNR